MSELQPGKTQPDWPPPSRACSNAHAATASRAHGQAHVHSHAHAHGHTHTHILSLFSHGFRYLDNLIGPYPAAKELYQQRSPIHSADKIKAPVALFQVRRCASAACMAVHQPITCCCC